MKSIFPALAFLLMFMSCSRQKADQAEADKVQKLVQDFENSWGQNSPAGDSARLALAALPGRNEYILYCRAWKNAEKGNLPSAIKTADSLVMGFPSFEKGIYLRANLRLENKDTSGSLSDFERCLKRNPAFYECRINRGIIFFSKQMPDLAYQDFREAVKLRPQSAEARLNLGNAQFALGQLDSACLQWNNAAASGLEKAAQLAGKFCQSPKP
jgi:tetratricopeptide (TPR) repeat protein